MHFLKSNNRDIKGCLYNINIDYVTFDRSTARVPYNILLSLEYIQPIDAWCNSWIGHADIDYIHFLADFIQARFSACIHLHGRGLLRFSFFKRSFCQYSSIFIMAAIRFPICLYPMGYSVSYHDVVLTWIDCHTIPSQAAQPSSQRAA